MRIDGQRTDQLRPLKLETGYTRWAEGSVLVTQGNTVVLCNATDRRAIATLDAAAPKRSAAG